MAQVVDLQPRLAERRQRRERQRLVAKIGRQGPSLREWLCPTEEPETLTQVKHARP